MHHLRQRLGELREQRLAVHPGLALEGVEGVGAERLCELDRSHRAVAQSRHAPIMPT